VGCRDTPFAVPVGNLEEFRPRARSVYARNFDCEGTGERYFLEVVEATPGLRAIAVTVPRATAPY